jgi:hypothetical protein
MLFLRADKNHMEEHEEAMNHAPTTWKKRGALLLTGGILTAVFAPRLMGQAEVVTPTTEKATQAKAAAPLACPLPVLTQTSKERQRRDFT